MKKFILNIHKIALIILFISYLGFSQVLAQPTMDLKGKINDAPDSIQLKGVVKIDRFNQRINLSLRDTDLQQVLRMLADKAGWNIVIHESVTGKITLDLMDVTLDKAFEYIMEMKGLTYSLDGNTIIISTKAVAGPLSLNKDQITPIKIKYLDAAKVASFLNNNIFSLNKPYLSTLQVVTSNPMTNQVIIFGNDDDVSIAEKIINLVDVKPNIKVFDVNYADVGLLSNTICQSVFNAATTGGSSTASSTGSTNQSNGYTVACGGASNASATPSAPSGGNSSSAAGSGQGGVFNGITSSLTAIPAPGYSVSYNADLGKISITGTNEQISLSEEYIKRIDRREPQVYLEINAVELTEDGQKELNSTIQSIPQYQLSNNTTGTPLPSLNLSPTQTTLTYNYQTITHAISAIISQDKGRTLTNPRILATNNLPSTINISDQILSGVTYQINQTTGAVSSESPNWTPVGIVITLTPYIKPNGYIALDLNANFSDTGNTVTLPGIDGQGTQTFTSPSNRILTLSKIRIKDGESLVIGGLMYETQTKSTTKVPFISDIPIAGLFFKNSNNQTTRRELVIIVTPKILKDFVKVDAT